MKKTTAPKHERIPTADIVTILQTCKNTGVSQFTLGDLQISFTPREAASRPPSPEDFELETQRRLDEDEDLEALEMQNLLITDPEAYEDRMRKVAHVQVRERTERPI